MRLTGPSGVLLPVTLARAIGECELSEVLTGRSGCRVYRVSGGGAPDRYLKLGTTDLPGEGSVGGLREEAERMEWLQGRLSVPELMEYGRDADHEWLLTSALPGSDATRPHQLHDAFGLVQLLAEGLRHLHDSLDVGSCPFDAGTALRVEQARQRVSAGLVETEELGPIYRGIAPEELLEHLLVLRPADEGELVVSHGDYCVPNVIVEQGQISGFVDLGRLGVADRYLDLAIALRSAALNFGADAAGVFLDAYGVEHPDLERLEFFALLDELL